MGGAWRSDPSRSHLEHLIDTHCLTDVQLHVHPGKVLFTWSNSRGSLKSRIDGIYTSVPSAAKTFTVTPLFIDTGRRFSDHSLVISDFAFERAPKPNRFLLTPEILGDEEFQEFTNQALDSLLVKPTTSLSDWISCKKEILSFAKRVDRKLKKRVHCWIRIYQRLLTTCILSADTCSYIRGLIPQVNDIITSLLVARVKHSYEHFKIDKVYAPRKFDAKFFGKLISTKKRNFIPSLSATNGDVITDAKEVSEEFYRHFSSFFSSSPVEEDLWGHLSQHVERVFLHPVPPVFTEEAVLDAISSINLGRSPGPDAIPAAFYRAFSSKLTPFWPGFSRLCAPLTLVFPNSTWEGSRSFPRKKTVHPSPTFGR